MTKKEAIVTAATELFAAKGFAETTTAEVAARAGVAQGTLFYHFKSKENILLAVFESVMVRYQTGMAAATATAANGMAAVEALLRFQLAFVEEHSREFRVVMRDLPSHLGGSDSPQREQVRQRQATVLAMLENALARGRTDGSMRPDLPATATAHILRGLVYGLVRHRLLGLIDLPPLEEDLIDFCRQALQAPAAGPC